MVTKDISRRLQVFVNNCFRRILGISWPEKVSNVDLWKRCGEVSIDQQIRCRKCKYGHSLRRDPDHIPRQALEWNTQGKRRCSRLKQTWRMITAEVKAVGMTWSEVKA
ncbi:uncharacterized protein [Battus philenor]|uniref:uncharacterized protein n=1 Tax=Battus philenor TaxID=42288 RepID=UPI0035CEDC80